MSKLEELRRKTQERLQAARNRLDETRERLGRVEDRLEVTRARLTNRSGLDEISSPPIPIEHRDPREHPDRKDPQNGSVQVSNEGFPPSGISSNQRANRKALFIGNDGPPLTQCVNDASDMETVFSKLGYQTTLLADQSIEEMTDAFNRLIEDMGSDDEIIVSFSGHGCCYKREVYLEGINGGLINLHEQLDRIQKRNPRMVLSIIDACRNKSENPSMENTKGDVASIAKYAGADSSWLHSKVRGQADLTPKSWAFEN